MLRSALLTLAAVAAWMPGSTVLASEDHQAVQWAAACFACHGPEGRSDGGMPSLAGQTADGMYAMLIDFRNGKRNPTVMHHHAKGYTEEQLRRIADILGRRPN